MSGNIADRQVFTIRQTLLSTLRQAPFSTDKPIKHFSVLPNILHQFTPEFSETPSRLLCDIDKDVWFHCLNTSLGRFLDNFIVEMIPTTRRLNTRDVVIEP
jgi:hypothetical protein